MSANKRPVVVLPCRYDWNRSYYELRETYSEAIYAAGGTPLLLPLIPEPDYIESVMAHADAVCLTGAISDVDPLRYGRDVRATLASTLADCEATCQPRAGP